MSSCNQQQVPVVFAMNRRRLAVVLKKKFNIGCVGVFIHAGAEVQCMCTCTCNYVHVIHVYSAIYMYMIMYMYYMYIEEKYPNDCFLVAVTHCSKHTAFLCILNTGLHRTLMKLRYPQASNIHVHVHYGYFQSHRHWKKWGISCTRKNTVIV